MKKFMFLAVLFACSVVTVQAQEVGKVFEKVVLIDSAAIQTSFDDSVTLVQAPNSSYMIVPIAVTAEMRKGDAAYSDASGKSIVTYEGLSAGVDLADILTATNDSTVTITGFPETLTSAAKGKNLVFKHTTANPTDGNGSLRLWILYRLLNLDSGGY